MKIIMCLNDKIQEELQDADSYIELAMRWKEEEPEAAELFYDLSTEEMKHMTMLHNKAVELIEAYKKENGDPPKGMQARYDWMHDKRIKDAMQIKVKQGMYKQ